ncbi:hypothetical protein N9841_02190, partial [Akkermansiaceae bacterium]|nr:hypothetical protein [Akkermansiaceae bacterium]
DFVVKKQDHAIHKVNLGHCYALGFSGKVNPKKAFYWFKKAASWYTGGADVQTANALVACYHHGFGVDKNPKKAAYWREKREELREKWKVNTSTTGSAPCGDATTLSLVGRWRDENSVHEYFPDGSYIAYHDDGKTLRWTWSVEGDLLTMEINGLVRSFRILEIGQSSYCISATDQKEIYHAHRIEGSR